MFDVAYFLPSDLLFNTCPPFVLKKKKKEKKKREEEAKRKTIGVFWLNIAENRVYL